jgi:hypothetical protein
MISADLTAKPVVHPVGERAAFKRRIERLLLGAGQDTGRHQRKNASVHLLGCQSNRVNEIIR